MKYLILLVLAFVGGCSLAGTNDKLNITQPSRSSKIAGEKTVVVRGAKTIVISEKGNIVVDGVDKVAK